MAGGRVSHRIRLVDAEGVRGDHRRGRRFRGCPRGRSRRRLPHPPPAPLRLEVPQGAIDGVAGRPRAHRARERLASQPALEVSAQPLDGFDHALDGLAVAGVGDAFAPARRVAVPELHEDGMGRAARPARDAEHPGERPGLPADREGRHGLRASRRGCGPRFLARGRCTAGRAPPRSSPGAPAPPPGRGPGC